VERDILEKLRKDAKEQLDWHYDECVPVTNDSFVCLLEEAANEIQKLRGELAEFKPTTHGERWN
jgi:hypothetical protein